MLPWTLLATSNIPGETEEMRLYRRGTEYSIRVGQVELMDSRVHGSEDALAELACARLSGRRKPRILIGGLGMGFTLRAVLQNASADAEVVVSELVPAVVEWNRGPLGELAGHPLRDERVRVREEDVAKILRGERSAWDAIILDVDNGPAGLTTKTNDRLYGMNGLRVIHAALRPHGILAVWSAGPNPPFTRRLEASGFDAREVTARGREGRGARYLVWIAERA
jgi:spermidine synthase